MIELERDAPDLEDLAAYLDGRLSGERKSRVEERLARDEDYYEVFLESVRSLQDCGRGEAAGEGGVVVRPAAWWQSWRAIAPLAMAATLVAAVGLARLMRGPSMNEWVTRLDAKAVTNSGDLWDDPDWKRSRGGSDPGSDPDLRRRQEVAFRIGTRTVDLRVALAAEDRSAARRAAADLEKLTGAGDFFPLSGPFAELRELIDGEELGALSARASELESHLADGFEDRPEEDRYRLGAWNEAGRLAALAHDAEVLAAIFRDRRIAQEIERIAPHLDEIEAVVEADPGKQDFKAAATAFSQIARALAGRG